MKFSRNYHRRKEASLSLRNPFPLVKWNRRSALTDLPIFRFLIFNFYRCSFCSASCFYYAFSFEDISLMARQFSVLTRLAKKVPSILDSQYPSIQYPPDRLPPEVQGTSRLSPGLCPILLTFETDVARSRLYRSQSLQVNTQFAAFFQIFKIIGIQFLICVVFSNLLHRFHNFCCDFAIFRRRF